MAEIVTPALNTAKIVSIERSIDAGWTLVAGILVFFMQAGFSLLEAGSVRHKNTINILMKNIIDTSVGAISWFLIGYGLAFGTSYEKFIGTDSFLMTHHDLKARGEGDFLYAFWFFQFTFCATAATIVSGALAERAKLEGYCIFTLFLTVFIYPIIVHWTWGGGFLTEFGYQDFAGSGVVHMTGGIAAIIGSIILGPRIGRFDIELYSKGEFNPASILNICLGTFILWFGWFGFNAGSTTALSGSNAEVAGHCAVTTTLAAACGGLMSFFLFSLKSKKYDVASFANGILAGLVSITASCNNVDTYWSCFIGLFGGIILFLTDYLFNYIGFKYYSLNYTILQIDDPLNAFAVHGACGIWGVIATGIFDMDNGIIYNNFDFMKLFVPNLFGVFVIIAWCCLTCIPIFLVLKYAKLLRVDVEAEKLGLDSSFVPQRIETPQEDIIAKQTIQDLKKMEENTA